MRLYSNILRCAVLLLAVFLFSAAALAQGTVQQSGPVVPFHGSVWLGNGTIGDAGAASGYSSSGTAAAGLSEQLDVVRGNGTPPFVSAGSGPLGTNVCDYDAPISNPTGYHFICLSPNIAGQGVIYYGYGGGASPQPFQFNVNGTYYSIAGTNLPQGTGVVITSVLSYQAVPNLETYAWKNSTAGTKTLTLFQCQTSTAWYEVTVADDQGTMGITGSNGVVAAFGSDKIIGASSFVINSPYGSNTFQCDGLGNWIAR